MTSPSARFSILLGALTCATLAGCALTTDTIVLNYTAPPPIFRIAGADHVAVQVRVNDLRRDPTRVGVKKNGYGVEMAPIVSSTNVANFVRATLEWEMRRRGFTLGTGGVLLNVDVRRYFNDFKPGFFTGDAVAEVVLDVTAFKLEDGVEGAPLFMGHFEGQGENRDIGIYGGDNAKVALDGAYNDVMRAMLTDRRLLAALMRSVVPPAQPPPSAAPAVTSPVPRS